MMIFRLCLLVAATALLFACAAPVKKESVDSFIIRQQNLADEKYQAGEAASALSHWQVILLVQPDHPLALQKHHELTKQLKHLADDRYRAGLRSTTDGNLKLAKRYFLQSLAADPAHSKSRQQLALMQKNKIHRAQNAKIRAEQLSIRTVDDSELSTQIHSGRLVNLFEEKQYAKLIKEAIDSQAVKNNHFISGLVARSYMELSQQFLDSIELDKAKEHYYKTTLYVIDDEALTTAANKLRDALALAYYRHGRKMLQADVSQAIASLQTSLELNPYDQRVKQVLNQAVQIRSKLAEINNKN